MFQGAVLVVLAVFYSARVVGENLSGGYGYVESENLSGGIWRYSMWQMIWLNHIIVMLYVKLVVTWNKMASIAVKYVSFFIEDMIRTWLCGFLYDSAFLSPIAVFIDTHSNN